MKLKSVISSMIFLSSSLALAKSPYEFVSVPHKEIDAHMTPGSDATGTPKALQGLWWMNGNPGADEVVSFAGVKFNEQIADGEIIGYEGALAVFDQSAWSWHDSKKGRQAYQGIECSKLFYVFYFDKDFTAAKVTPNFKPICKGLRVEIPAFAPFFEFSMTYVNDDEYRRDSIVFGQKQSYRLRRIVDADGNRLPAFQEFVDLVEVPNALLPICQNNTNESFPTSCVKPLKK